MTKDVRKTIQMPKEPTVQGRETQRMGIGRDTVKDPPKLHDTTGPAPQRALGPRGTQVVSQKTRDPIGKPSDRALAGEVVIGVGKSPRADGDDKIDLSRADPRRAPTQLRVRRPDAYLPPDESVAHRPRGPAPPAKKRPLNAVTVSIIVVAILAVTALVLGVLLLRQQGALR